MKVKEFDRVLLKDGREGDVMDVSEDVSSSLELKITIAS